MINLKKDKIFVDISSFSINDREKLFPIYKDLGKIGYRYCKYCTVFTIMYQNVMILFHII